MMRHRIRVLGDEDPAAERLRRPPAWELGPRPEGTSGDEKPREGCGFPRLPRGFLCIDAGRLSGRHPDSPSRTTTRTGPSPAGPKQTPVGRSYRPPTPPSRALQQRRRRPTFGPAPRQPIPNHHPDRPLPSRPETDAGRPQLPPPNPTLPRPPTAPPPADFRAGTPTAHPEPPPGPAPPQPARTGRRPAAATAPLPRPPAPSNSAAAGRLSGRHPDSPSRTTTRTGPSPAGPEQTPVGRSYRFHPDHAAAGRGGVKLHSCHSPGLWFGLMTVEAAPLLETLSPSRAGDFKTCPLLFKFRAVDRLPEPVTPHQARGTAAHLALHRLFDLPGGQRT